MAIAVPTTEPRAAGGTDPMLPRPYRVRARRRETRDTWTFDLVATDDRPCDPFLPGQFFMLYVFGVGEVPISVSGDPREAGVLRHTVRSIGPVTRALAGLRKGDPIGVRGPYGTPWPMAELLGADVVLVAGGIGLAPLRPVVLAIAHDRVRYGRVSVLVGARSVDDMPFRKELARWRAALDLEVLVTVDRADPAWRGDVGVVTRLLRRAPFDPGSAVALVCGPEIMMRFAAQQLANRDVPAERVWLSIERNMKCGIGLCGHCQFGPEFVCRDGPVFRLDRVGPLLNLREV